MARAATKAKTTTLGTGAALTTNADRLVEIAVRGEISHPITERNGYDLTRDGVAQTLPGVGGIVYSHFVGDPCVGILGDHIEPGASVTNFESKWSHDAAKSALNVLAQIGNTAVVASGDARGCLGTVIGKHGGVEHVVVHFPARVLDLLDIGDQVRVRAQGVGLRVEGADVHMRNLDPRLLARLPLTLHKGVLQVGVSHVVPAALMGSGLGGDNTNRGDYDIQLSDPALVRKHRLDTLRFGDIVAIQDTFDAWGRSFRPGAVSIGVVVHGDSQIAGHGPGVTTVMSALDGRIAPVVTRGANVATLLGLSRESPGAHHAEGLMTRHESRLRKAFT